MEHGTKQLKQKKEGEGRRRGGQGQETRKNKRKAYWGRDGGGSELEDGNANIKIRGRVWGGVGDVHHMTFLQAFSVRLNIMPPCNRAYLDPVGRGDRERLHRAGVRLEHVLHLGAPQTRVEQPDVSILPANGHHCPGQQTREGDRSEKNTLMWG